MYNLLQYVSDVLKPTSDQDNFIRSKLKRIESVIKNNTALSLKEVIHGGSYKKGTMLKDKPDVDLVLIFNKEPGISRNWKALMEKVYANLKSAFPNEEKELGENIAIHLKFKKQNEAINFDIVPSYYVNSPLQMASVKNSNIYQGMTSLWHIEYWKQKKNIPYITETVMLLKDWNNKHLKNKHEVQLKSFHMEIIAACVHKKYRLENKYTIETFLISCFQGIQGMIDGAPIYPVDWEYFESSIKNKHYNNPLLIDPANPKDNLLKGLSCDNARKIKSEATKAIYNIKNGNYGKVF
jgi:hypothetical protein